MKGNLNFFNTLVKNIATVIDKWSLNSTDLRKYSTTQASRANIITKQALKIKKLKIFETLQ